MPLPTALKGYQRPLVKYSYSQEKKRHKLQIVYGLLCAHEGRPLAVMAYPGNTDDSATLAGQRHKIHQQFKLKNVAFTADRGMLNNVRIEAEMRNTAGREWITVSHKAIAKPARRPLQTTLFDTAGLVTFTHTGENFEYSIDQLSNVDYTGDV